MKSLRTGTVGIALLALGVTGAIAGGLGDRGSIKDGPHAAPFSWTGFYIGANAGIGWAGGGGVNLFTNDVILANLGDATTPSRGTIGNIGDEVFGIWGAQVGFQKRVGQLVFGVEADVEVPSLRDRLQGRFTNPNGLIPIDGDASFATDWMGSLRARIGVLASNDLLFYATAGWAVGKVDYVVTAKEVQDVGGAVALFQSRVSDSVQNGYVVGGGLEYAFDPRFTLKLEYQYMNLGKVDGSGPVTRIATGAPTGEIATLGDITADFHTVRLGINYHFGRE